MKMGLNAVDRCWQQRSVLVDQREWVLMLVVEINACGLTRMILYICICRYGSVFVAKMTRSVEIRLRGRGDLSNEL